MTVMSLNKLSRSAEKDDARRVIRWSSEDRIIRRDRLPDCWILRNIIAGPDSRQVAMHESRVKPVPWCVRPGRANVKQIIETVGT